MPIRKLRESIAEVDAQIVRLIGERQRLAIKLGLELQRAGEPAEDFEYEKLVHDGVAAAARQYGVNRDLAADVIGRLMRSASTVQERGRVRADATGLGRRALVIGGRGRMGRWFVRFLSSQRYEVVVADPAGPVENFGYLEDWSRSPLDFELIVVAAPLEASNEILIELSGIESGALILDIASLKGPVRSGLEALARGSAQVASIHPLFGPDTELLSGRHVIVIDIDRPQAARRAAALFGSTSCRVVDMRLEDHDRLMAFILGLSHALNIAFFTALAESGESVPKLMEVSSTTFDAQLAVAARVAHENPGLYFEIQSRNEYGGEALSYLGAAVERLRSILRSRDQGAFARLMLAGRRYLEGRTD